MKDNLRIRREKRTRYARNKATLKFDNLRLLDIHAELSILRMLKQQINLILRNKLLNEAIDEIMAEENDSL